MAVLSPMSSGIRQRDQIIAITVAVLATAITLWSIYTANHPARFFIELQVMASGTYSRNLTFLATIMSLFGLPALLRFLKLAVDSYGLAHHERIPTTWSSFGRTRRLGWFSSGLMLIVSTGIFGAVLLASPELVRGSEWLVDFGILLLAFGPWVGPFLLFEGALPSIYRVADIDDMRIDRVQDRDLYRVVLVDGITIDLECRLFQRLARGDKIAVLFFSHDASRDSRRTTRYDC